jgi:2-iminobutanoate/2-iminopropanoate deaminase
MKTNRRSIFKKLALGLTGVLGFSVVKAAATSVSPTTDKETDSITYDQDGVPLFAGSTTFGNLVFIAGKGAHFEGDIKSHTKKVLEELKSELEKAGSSMDQVLKVNVYLNDIKDWSTMNEVYAGSFGKKPPVRTTIAAAGGIPGNSLVEMDCIAYKK